VLTRCEETVSDLVAVYHDIIDIRATVEYTESRLSKEVALAKSFIEIEKKRGRSAEKPWQSITLLLKCSVTRSAPPYSRISTDD
jgi:hypothetical protein